MTLLAQLQTRAYKLDRRFFAFFLLLQAVILVAVLLEAVDAPGCSLGEGAGRPGESGGA